MVTTNNILIRHKTRVVKSFSKPNEPTVQVIFLHLLLYIYIYKGCDQAKGQYYCAIKNKCVSTWDSCEDFYGYNELCTGKWSGLTWDLSPLKGKTFTITDSFTTGPSYAYAFSICGNADLTQSSLTDELISTCKSTKGAAGEVLTNDAPVYQVYNDIACERAGEDQSGSTKGNLMFSAFLRFSKLCSSFSYFHLSELLCSIEYDAQFLIRLMRTYSTKVIHIFITNIYIYIKKNLLLCLLKERFQRGNQMEWALLDPLNPAMGIELTYVGGNTCKQSTWQDSSQCTYSSNGQTYCQRGMRIRMVIK
jgi:hypothetical protein